MSQIKQEYAGVGDYLKVKVFGLNTQPGPDGKRVAIDEAFTERRVVWRVNVSISMVQRHCGAITADDS